MNKIDKRKLRRIIKKQKNLKKGIKPTLIKFKSPYKRVGVKQ